MALMPPAIPATLPGSGAGVIDPTWITAGSQVLGAALKSSPAGPSQSDSGGIFSTAAPFNVTTGSGDASLTPSNSILPIIVMAVIGVIAWKLLKNS